MLRTQKMCAFCTAYVHEIEMFCIQHFLPVWTAFRIYWERFAHIAMVIFGSIKSKYQYQKVLNFVIKK